MSNFTIENLVSAKDSMRLLYSISTTLEVGTYTLIMLFASELYYNMFAIPSAEMFLI